VHLCKLTDKPFSIISTCKKANDCQFLLEKRACTLQLKVQVHACDQVRLEALCDHTW